MRALSDLTVSRDFRFRWFVRACSSKLAPHARYDRGQTSGPKAITKWKLLVLLVEVVPPRARDREFA